MKLLLFFIVLTISITRQQDSTETLNETLDRLIKQTNKDHSEKNDSDFHTNKNNSQVIYLKSPENRRQLEKNSETKETNIQIEDGNLVGIIDILHALGLRDLKSDDKGDKGNSFKEITFTVEDNAKPTNTGTGGEQKLLGQLISKSGSSEPSVGESSVDATVTSGSKSGINLLHKYPEIIIDKIIHQSDKNQAEKVTENKAVTENEIDKNAANQNSLKIAQELKTLLLELQKMKAETASNIDLTINHPNMPQDTESNSQDAITQQCNNAIVQYQLPCKSVLLNKLTGYQDSLRSGGPDLDASLQLNIWGGHNTRRNSLMGISRIQKLKRIQFITQLINNMMSRFVYRPLYGYF